MIVWLNDGYDSRSFIQSLRSPNTLQQKNNPFSNSRLKKIVSRELGIYLLEEIDASQEQYALEMLKQQPMVLLAQFNHYVESRKSLDSIPSDPRFGTQWNLNNTGQTGGAVDADIDAPEAWEFAQGGTSACQDTIVIAIVDDGTDLTHEDFSLWTNRFEIPGNNRDDDRDGYLDNYEGWDAFTNTGVSQPSTFHGTAVAGIATAQGDNNIGISGVAWQSRLMAIAGASNDEATVVGAYGYLLAQRKRYDATGGREGAFVVAANSSFGVNSADPVNFPIWCAMYDTLGAHGILSVSSVANLNIDLDLINDMPTGCSSDYLITVTATNSNDERDLGTAFGRTMVDIAAPGRSVPCTAPNNRYSQISGSSAAAPHVTGAIALLMDHAGERFLSVYDNQPQFAADMLKTSILSSVDRLPSLIDSSVSGGRLNVSKALDSLSEMEQMLPECYPPFRLFAIAGSDSSAAFEWKGPALADSFLMRLRVAGSAWDSVVVGSDEVLLEARDACSEYEWMVASYCQGTIGEWSQKAFVQTLGCCIPPEQNAFPEIEGDSIVLGWSSVFGIDSFLIRWQVGMGPWLDSAVLDTQAVFSNLDPCSPLRYQLASYCDTGLSAFTPVETVSTPGCGACTEKEFCDAFTIDPGGDWIERVTIGDLDMESGNNFGYASFASTAVRLERGQRYAIRLEPGFAGTAFGEYWRIWLDANQSGDFDDPSELIYDSGGTSDTVILDSITIPAIAWGGPSRLRVRMRFAGAPEPCDGIGFGESEDYCIAVNGFVAIPDPRDQALEFSVFPNPVINELNITSDELLDQVAVFDSQGRCIHRFDEKGKAFNLITQSLSPGLYIVLAKRGEIERRKKVVIQR